MKTKTVTLKLKFGKYKHCLWNIAHKNFIKDQPERFVLLEGRPCTTGTMYFCNTYLEAQFVMALENGVGLYSDEDADKNNSYTVCTKKKFQFKE